jgi:hypothetical protein
MFYYIYEWYNWYYSVKETPVELPQQEIPFEEPLPTQRIESEDTLGKSEDEIEPISQEIPFEEPLPRINNKGRKYK